MTGSSENTCGGEEAIFAVESNFEKEAYKQAVTLDRVLGDIYIANMTRHLKIKSPKKPWEVFEELRQNNPSPFGGYLNYGDFQVVCASPERFLKMRNGHISTRPIKGTRKRGADPKEDLAMRLELENSEKDKSELLMIVDLERNDLNRVCVPGSVRVTELFTVEEYATVFHLVANVEGDLAPGNTVMDLVEAAFPGGSITGGAKAAGNGNHRRAGTWPQKSLHRFYRLSDPGRLLRFQYRNSDGSALPGRLVSGRGRGNHLGVRTGI